MTYDELEMQLTNAGITNDHAPRARHYAQSAAYCFYLAEEPCDTTLLHRFFHDQLYRDHMIQAVRNANPDKTDRLGPWEAYNQLPEAEQRRHILPLQRVLWPNLVMVKPDVSQATDNVPLEQQLWGRRNPNSNPNDN